jgi:uncharacterized protein (DUF2345 family)
MGDGEGRSFVTRPTPEGVGRVRLASGYEIDVADAEQREIRILAPGGATCVRITLSEAGPIVEVQAAQLAVHTAGKLDLSAGSLSLHATEDVEIRAGRNVSIVADAEIETVAFSQRIEATRGDVHLVANDDVRVDGERIRLNAPDAPALRKRGTEIVREPSDRERSSERERPTVPPPSRMPSSLPGAARAASEEKGGR